MATEAPEERELGAGAAELFASLRARRAAEYDRDEARRARAHAQLRQLLLEFVGLDLALWQQDDPRRTHPGRGGLRRESEVAGRGDGHRESGKLLDQCAPERGVLPDYED